MKPLQNPQLDSSYEMADPNIHSVPNNAIGDYDYNNRVLPRQMSTGALRGTQNVGYGNVKIDGSNNQIIFGSDQSTEGTSLVIGALTPTNTTQKELGIEINDINNFTLFKMDGETWFWYDKSTGKNIMQIGKLPDGSYGWAVATPGNDINDSF